MGLVVQASVSKSNIWHLISWRSADRDDHQVVKTSCNKVLMRRYSGRSLKIKKTISEGGKFCQYCDWTGIKDGV